MYIQILTIYLVINLCQVLTKTVFIGFCISFTDEKTEAQKVLVT